MAYYCEKEARDAAVEEEVVMLLEGEREDREV